MMKLGRKRQKEKIMFISMDFFSKYGYAHSTIREICDKAKINLASINYYFRSKDRLYLEVCKFLTESLTLSENVIKPLYVRNETDWENEIALLAKGATAEMFEEDNYAYLWYRIMAFERVDPSPVSSIIFNRMTRPIYNRIRQLILMGMPADATEEDVAIVFFSILAQIEGIVYYGNPLVKSFIKYDEIRAREPMARLNLVLANAFKANLAFQRNNLNEHGQIVELQSSNNGNFLDKWEQSLVQIDTSTLELL